MRLSKWLLNYLTKELSCSKNITRNESPPAEIIKVTQHISGSTENGPIVKLVSDLDLSIKASFSPATVRKGILEENEGADWSCSTVLLRKYNLTVLTNENGEKEIALEVHDCALNQLEDGFHLKNNPGYWSSVKQLNILFQAYLNENCANSNELSCDDGSCPLTQLVDLLGSEKEDSCSDRLTSVKYQCSCIARPHQRIDLCNQHFMISLEDQKQLSAIKEWSTNYSMQLSDVEPDDDEPPDISPPDISQSNKNKNDDVLCNGELQMNDIDDSGCTSYQSCRQFSGDSKQLAPLTVSLEREELSIEEAISMIPGSSTSCSVLPVDIVGHSSIEGEAVCGKGELLSSADDFTETRGSDLTSLPIVHNTLENQQKEIDTSGVIASSSDDHNYALSIERNDPLAQLGQLVPSSSGSDQLRDLTSLPIVNNTFVNQQKEIDTSRSVTSSGDDHNYALSNECNDPLAQLGQLVPSSSGSDQLLSTGDDVQCRKPRECMNDCCVNVMDMLFMHAEGIYNTCNDENIPCQSTQIDRAAPCAGPRFSTSPVRPSLSQLDSANDDIVFPVHSTQADQRSSDTPASARILPLNISPIVRSSTTLGCMQEVSNSDLTTAGTVKDRLFVLENEACDSSFSCETDTTRSVLLEPNTPCVASCKGRQVSGQSTSVSSVTELCIPESIASGTQSDDVLESSFIDGGGTAVVGSNATRNLSSQSIVVTDDDTSSAQPSHTTGGNSSQRMNSESEQPIMNYCAATTDSIQCSQSDGILISNVRTVMEDSEVFQLWCNNNNSFYSQVNAPNKETSAEPVLEKSVDTVSQSLVPIETSTEGNYTQIKVHSQNTKQDQDLSTVSNTTLTKTETRRSIVKTSKKHKLCESDVLFKHGDVVKRGKRKIFRDQVLMELPVKEPSLVAVRRPDIMKGTKANEDINILPPGVQTPATSLVPNVDDSCFGDERKTRTVENLETHVSSSVLKTLPSTCSSSLRNQVCESVEMCEVKNAQAKLSFQDIFVQKMCPSNVKPEAVSKVLENIQQTKELVTDGVETSSNSSLDGLNELSKKASPKRLHGMTTRHKSSEDGWGGQVQAPAASTVRNEEYRSPVSMDKRLPSVAPCVEEDHQTNSPVVKRLRSVIRVVRQPSVISPCVLKSKDKTHLNAIIDVMQKSLQPHFDGGKFKVDPSSSSFSGERNGDRLCDTKVPFSSRIATEVTLRDKRFEAGCETPGFTSSNYLEGVQKSLQTPKNSMPSNQLNSLDVSGQEMCMSTTCDGESRLLSSANEVGLVTNELTTIAQGKARCGNASEQTDRGALSVKETIVAGCFEKKLDCSSLHSNQSRVALQTPKNSFPSHQPIPPANSNEDKTSLDSDSSQSQTQNRINFGRIQEILGIRGMNAEQRNLFTHKLPAAVEQSAFDYFKRLHRS